MIDITHKNSTKRTATAQATVVASDAATIEAVQQGKVPKGDVLEASRIAALFGVKRTADLIPDFLIGLGYIDDVALLAWTVRSISGELDKFAEWKKIQTSAMGPERARSSRARQGLLIEGELSSH